MHGSAREATILLPLAIRHLFGLQPCCTFAGCAHQVVDVMLESRAAILFAGPCA